MDKKNTLLLTVIAVATLLVAIVGATFAYFTAQLGGGKEVPITVETNTVDTTTFAQFDSLAITANQENFADTKGSLRSETTGYVSFTPTNATGDGIASDRNYCYKASVKIETEKQEKNDFVYSLPKTYGDSHNANYPELVLSIWKKENVTNAGDDPSSQLSSIEDTYLYKQTFLLSDNKNVVYDESILEEAKICKADGSTELGEEGECTDSQTIKGYDITIFGNSEVEGTDFDLHNVTEITIPNRDTNTGSFDENNLIHKMTAQAGSKNHVYDLWKVALTFVNYSDKDINTTDEAQAITNWKAAHPNSGEHIADQHDNEGKTFKARLVFTPTACSE